jgi:hypothetical protein
MEFNGGTNKLNSNITNFHLNRNPSVNNSLKVKYISIDHVFCIYVNFIHINTE